MENEPEQMVWFLPKLNCKDTIEKAGGGERNEDIGLHKNQYMNVSRGIIHNDQKVEMKY